MAIVLITNRPIQSKRPSLNNSKMFVAPPCYGGGLRWGNYMKVNAGKAEFIHGISDKNMALISSNNEEY